MFFNFIEFRDESLFHLLGYSIIGADEMDFYPEILSNQSLDFYQQPLCILLAPNIPDEGKDRSLYFLDNIFTFKNFVEFVTVRDSWVSWVIRTI